MNTRKGCVWLCMCAGVGVCVRACVRVCMHACVCYNLMLKLLNAVADLLQ